MLMNDSTDWIMSLYSENIGNKHFNINYSVLKYVKLLRIIFGKKKLPSAFNLKKT